MFEKLLKNVFPETISNIKNRALFVKAIDAFIKDAQLLIQTETHGESSLEVYEYEATWDWRNRISPPIEVAILKVEGHYQIHIFGHTNLFTTMLCALGNEDDLTKKMEKKFGRSILPFYSAFRQLRKNVCYDMIRDWNAFEEQGTALLIARIRYFIKTTIANPSLKGELSINN